MLLRQLEYLVALTGTGHFAKAAEQCFVSQPTLSEGIRKLETELGVPLVRRGRRFEGLTAEGEQVVLWARRMLADRDAMESGLAALREGLSGELRLGAVPTAVGAVALLTQPFCAANPHTTVNVQADLQGDDIVRRLRAFELHGAVSYHSRSLDLPFVPLYRERYVVLTQEDQDRTAQEISWAEAAALPLCLLHPRMLGRRVLDDVFAELSLSVAPRVETDSIASLIAHVRTGQWSSIIPHTWLHVFGIPSGMEAVPLHGPRRSARIGLLLPPRDPLSVMEQALADLARASRMHTVLDVLPG
ncbi:LysR family transcriptional regulator [Streptomyces endophyticus]|uniref:LysR family transcriptional regulator n=1 Tax=Streptomyces endophyticus TaxID=714166 RepID=A0ABU6EWI4_9ACTN|nr:LysR family transcriptional regulator [Streptomyces endophyticus]MEB8336037.1 LysR family transcriptional regulator [Streptomyces endophyticus]